MLSRLLLAAAVVAVVSFTGCGPADQLIGKWETDISGVQSQIENSGNPIVSAFASVLSQVKAEAEFKADGTCTISGSMFGQSASAGAKWRYVKSDGNVLVLMLTREQGGDEKELRVKFIDRDHFEVVPPAGQESGQNLTFKRVAAK